MRYLNINLFQLKINGKKLIVLGTVAKNNCINTNNPSGICIKGNGFGNIINDENIKYILCLEGKGYDSDVFVYAENSFTKPENCLNYSLYYFEIKCKFEVKKIRRRATKRPIYDYKMMIIGLRNRRTHDFIEFSANSAKISNDDNESSKLSSFIWNNNDFFGCGLIYPPTNMSNKFSYVSLHKMENKLGNTDSYKPYVFLNCCSVEANFGNDLETKPFEYDISKHLILKEFY
uniref:Uncharacterized protein n=1 Tax=Meloidogyne enterolobii TaxID=390850 RepID=A0A6V7VMW0_MELEN|nr:unnamed protein product [Meloidogyne enterolobii]